MWELLSNTKRKCWKAWLILASIIVVITLIQTFSGRLEEIELFSWLWVGLNLFPGFVLVFVSFLLDRRTTKMIPTTVHYILWVGSIIYLVLLLVTILMEGIATTGKLSFYDYRVKSLLWTIPVQSILILGYILIFFRKEPIFKPDRSAIQQLASKEAEKWEKRQEEPKKEFFTPIAFAKITEAFAKAKELIEEGDASNLNRLILMESQFNKVEEDFQMNLISYEEYHRTRNRIILGLMNFINTI